MSDRNIRARRQAAALAWLGGEGPLRFVLVTSRRRRRWIFPKGAIEPGQTPPEAAAREAFEEAGVVGLAEAQPVGTFRTWKLRPPHSWTLLVDVYPVRVEEVRDTWQEAAERERRFVTLDEARRLLPEPDMIAIAERFAESHS